MNINELLSKVKESNSKYSKTTIFTPLKVGRHTAKVVGVGICGWDRVTPYTEAIEALKEIGFYLTNQKEGQEEYIRIDFETKEGKKTIKNLFPKSKGFTLNMSNLKRQMHLEEDASVTEILIRLLADKPDIDIWVNYNGDYKNVDFYDAEANRTPADPETFNDILS